MEAHDVEPEEFADEAPVDTTPPTHELTIPMPVWHTVYATLDNNGSVERVGGDPAVAARSDRIQDAGGAAARRHPGPLTAHGWPHDDDALTVPLADGDEEFLVEILARWRRVGVLQVADDDVEGTPRREQNEGLEADGRALRCLVERLPY